MGGRFEPRVSNTASVDVMATWCATRSRIVSRTSGPSTSTLFSIYAKFARRPGHSSGFLPESDGAKMPRDFEPMSVSVDDGRFQLIRREVVVCLERGHALGGPIIHRARRVVRIRKRVHLDSEAAFALEVGASHVEFWSGQQSRVDLSLQFQVGVRLYAARSPRRRHAASQIETRSAIR